MWILGVNAIKGDRVVTVLEEAEPNSINWNRPILEAVGDENDHHWAILHMVALETAILSQRQNSQGGVSLDFIDLS